MATLLGQTIFHLSKHGGFLLIHRPLWLDIQEKLPFYQTFWSSVSIFTLGSINGTLFSMLSIGPIYSESQSESSTVFSLNFCNSNSPGTEILMICTSYCWSWIVNTICSRTLLSTLIINWHYSTPWNISICWCLALAVGAYVFCLKYSTIALSVILLNFCSALLPIFPSTKIVLELFVLINKVWNFHIFI